MFEDILEKKDWTREERVLLSVIITLNDLAEMGIFTEGPFEIVDIEKAKEIAGDISPTEEEVNSIIVWMKEEGYME